MTGIIPLDKGENITSFFAVNKLRRILGEKKCGHTGTLDPNATGVLPVAAGGATRFIELLPDHTKKYEASFRTGLCTDTLDIWGKVISESGKTASLEEITAVLPQFRGNIEQLPPMYSALRKDGVRLYELARKGVEVEREKRACTVYSLEVGTLLNGEFSLSCECSAGTYIRSLISDIGDLLGCGAVMTSLRRTAACGIEISSCFTLDEISEAAQNGSLDGIIIPLEKLLAAYPAVEVTEKQGIRFKNGGDLMRDRLKNISAEGLVRVYAAGEFLGLGELSAESESLTVKRVYQER